LLLRALPFIVLTPWLCLTAGGMILILVWPAGSLLGLPMAWLGLALGLRMNHASSVVRWGGTFIAACLLVVGAAFAGGWRPDSPGVIRAEEFGADWPFTVDSGRLRCEVDGPRQYVTFEATGLTYAVNGAARGTGRYLETGAIRRRVPAPADLATAARIPEPDRMAIFAEVVACDGTNDFATGACRAKVGAARKVTVAEIDLVVNEGAEKFWPPLEPFFVNVGPIIDAGLRLCR
jgi:hypothetical protein